MPYNEYKKAMLKKKVKVINPEAFKYNEFPIIMIEGNMAENQKDY